MYPTLESHSGLWEPKKLVGLALKSHADSGAYVMFLEWNGVVSTVHISFSLSFPSALHPAWLNLCKLNGGMMRL